MLLEHVGIFVGVPAPEDAYRSCEVVSVIGLHNIVKRYKYGVAFLDFDARKPAPERLAFSIGQDDVHEQLLTVAEVVLHGEERPQHCDAVLGGDAFYQVRLDVLVSALRYAAGLVVHKQEFAVEYDEYARVDRLHYLIENVVVLNHLFFYGACRVAYDGCVHDANLLNFRL